MKSFDKEAIKAIFCNCCIGMTYVREDGVWPCFEYFGADPSMVRRWTPAWDLYGVNSDKQHDEPGLPIPFNANQLAAFMLDGVGANIRAVHGDWDKCPLEEKLTSTGIQGEGAEAIRAAYAAFQTALGVVGKLDSALKIQAKDLAAEYNKKLLEARTREGVLEKIPSSDETRRRRLRAIQSVVGFSQRYFQVKQQADTAFTVWRQQMVSQLLGVALESEGQAKGDKPRPKIVLPAGTERVDVIDIPILMAEAYSPRSFAGRDYGKVLGINDEDAKDYNAAQDSETVQLYILERAYLKALTLAIKNGFHNGAVELPVHSKQPGVQILEYKDITDAKDITDVYVLIDDFKAYVKKHGMDVQLGDPEPEVPITTMKGSPEAVGTVAASGGVKQVAGKRWTPEKLAEMKSYREKNGTKKTAVFFGISEPLVRRKLPSEKSQPQGYTTFMHRAK